MQAPCQPMAQGLQRARVPAKTVPDWFRACLPLSVLPSRWKVAETVHAAHSEPIGTWAATTLRAGVSFASLAAVWAVSLSGRFHLGDSRT